MYYERFSVFSQPACFLFFFCKPFFLSWQSAQWHVCTLVFIIWYTDVHIIYYMHTSGQPCLLLSGHSLPVDKQIHTLTSIIYLYYVPPPLPSPLPPTHVHLCVKVVNYRWTTIMNDLNLYVTSLSLSFTFALLISAHYVVPQW